MRKRQLKKFAKNAKKNMTPYRKARGKGSKKDCRRLKAFKRVSRRIKDDHIRGLGVCTAVLEELNAYKPANEAEAAKLHKCKLKVQDRLQQHRDAIEFDRETREFERQMAVMKHVMKKYIETMQVSGSVG